MHNYLVASKKGDFKPFIVRADYMNMAGKKLNEKGYKDYTITAYTTYSDDNIPEHLHPIPGLTWKKELILTLENCDGNTFRMA